ncbi:MAG: class I SAM-dependent methyltransferase, partial [Saprospiraceae bacterium]
MPGYYTILNFLGHRIRSRKWDSFHSPYLFRLLTDCCNEKITFPVFERIESKRKEFFDSSKRISRMDYGAGMISGLKGSNQKISTIANRSISLPYQCRFLYRLVNMLKPHTMIEFGTCLGISSAYLAMGATGGKLITIEGDTALAEEAEKIFESLEIKNIVPINSTFENFIENELKATGPLDFVFLDGNHKSAALIKYYQALKPHFNPNTIVVVDDIYWSSDMYKGWNSLVAMPEVRQSVDCFQFGL